MHSSESTWGCKHFVSMSKNQLSKTLRTRWPSVNLKDLSLSVCLVCMCAHIVSVFMWVWVCVHEFVCLCGCMCVYMHVYSLCFTTWPFSCFLPPVGFFPSIGSFLPQLYPNSCFIDTRKNQFACPYLQTSFWIDDAQQSMMCSVRWLWAKSLMCSYLTQMNVLKCGIN